MTLKNNLFAVLAGCMISVLPAHGQFVTKRLASLAKSTGITISDTLRESKQKDLDSVFYFRNHPLHIMINDQGEISHLGYSLFSENRRRDSKTAVYDFLERYILELDLLENSAKRELQLKLDGVTCNGDPVKMLESDGADESLKINYEPNHKYLVQWQRGRNRLVMAFDAHYQLLLGANDIELEEIVRRRINRIANQHDYSTDFKLIFDRYGYVKDTVNFSRQDVVTLIEEECKEQSLQRKNDTDDVLFAINREMGFVHLASFKPGQARLYMYIPIHDAPDSFINQLVPPTNNQKLDISPMDSIAVTAVNKANQDSVGNGTENCNNEESLIIRQCIQNIENAIIENNIHYLDSIWYNMKSVGCSDDIDSEGKTKKQLLRNIQRINSREQWMDVRTTPMAETDHDSLKVYMGKPVFRGKRHFYGVYFRLELRSKNYYENNYIFMIVEINENKEAIIHCSFLQHGMQDGKKIAPSQKYKVNDFETIINIDGL